jgi:hypothetical protein
MLLKKGSNEERRAKTQRITRRYYYTERKGKSERGIYKERRTAAEQEASGRQNLECIHKKKTNENIGHIGNCPK